MPVEKVYDPVSLLGIHLFPTVVVFLGCLPLFPALAEPVRPLGALDLVFANDLAVLDTVSMIAARVDAQGRFVCVEGLFYRRVTDGVKRHLKPGLVRPEHKGVDGSLRMIQRAIIPRVVGVRFGKGGRAPADVAVQEDATADTG